MKWLALVPLILLLGYRGRFWLAYWLGRAVWRLGDAMVSVAWRLDQRSTTMERRLACALWLRLGRVRLCAMTLTRYSGGAPDDVG